ncbi:MAG: hypothetical protein OXL41_09630, partial [Nitrospinae bacterium]|nr:hypothetical protein [Nitrospinota bacterium]
MSPDLQTGFFKNPESRFPAELTGRIICVIFRIHAKNKKANSRSIRYFIRTEQHAGESEHQESAHG